MSDFGQPYGDPTQRPADGTTPQYPGAPQPAPGMPQPAPGAPPYYGAPQPYAAPPGAPGYPQAFPPPPPPKKSRTGLIIAIVAIVVLVLCGGLVAVGIAVYNARDDIGGTTSPTGSAPVTAPAAGVSLEAPNQIGDLKKSADQSRADTLRSTLTNGGIEEPFAVVYEDTAQAGRQVIVWGGTGPIFGTGSRQAQLNGFFSSAGAQLSGGTISDRAPVSAGSVGGLAECEKVSGMGVAMSLCAWIGEDALVGFILTGYSPAEAGEAVPEILSAIVKK